MDSDDICWVSGSAEPGRSVYNVLNKSDRPSFFIIACNFFFLEHLVLAFSVLTKYHERVIDMYM
jgi:hypothetical protein